MRQAKLRRLAREIVPLLTDGRPPGCTCPPDPGYNRLPSDNRHHGSKRCIHTTADADMRDRHLAR